MSLMKVISGGTSKVLSGLFVCLQFALCSFHVVDFFLFSNQIGHLSRAVRLRLCLLTFLSRVQLVNNIPLLKY